ncbi:DNA-binding domain-containing protein, AraC-type [Leptolyngbyaceae cyanobacterium JSC-12]|nr:DNA-binding domain-containing protein, AraC-type [Leptolyngbyaceae cyanobacterium JSC-12]
MPTDKTLTVDYFQSNSTSQLLPSLPILTSYQSKWQGIQLACHRQPAWEIPELSGSQHIVVVPIVFNTVQVEFWSERRLQNFQYRPDDYANRCIEVFPANLPYKVSWNQEVEFIHCYLEPTVLANVAHETVDPDQVELLLELQRSDALIHSLCLALRTALTDDGLNSCFYAESLTVALSAHLLRHYTTRKHHIQEYSGGLPKNKLQQVIDYINEHLGEDLSLATIATNLEMSQYYFWHLFKQSIGMTPHKYLIQQRVERAKELLKQPKITITEIALECGFTHQSHFAKQFKRLTGITPGQFRKK